MEYIKISDVVMSSNKKIGLMENLIALTDQMENLLH